MVIPRPVTARHARLEARPTDASPRMYLQQAQASLLQCDKELTGLLRSQDVGRISGAEQERRSTAVPDHNDPGRRGEAPTGPPAAAGFDWSSAKSSVPSTEQQSAAAGATTPTFQWPSPTATSNTSPPTTPPGPATQPQRSAPPTTQTQTPQTPIPRPRLGPLNSPPTQPSAPPAGSQPAQPSTHSSTAASPPTASLLDRAKANDEQALATLFGQFLPGHEQILNSQYLGVLGMWGIGTHSFAALTTHRVAHIRISILGRIIYQDGYLEYLNSSALNQPSRLSLYIYTVAISILFGIAGLPLGIIGVALGVALSIVLLPITVRLYYRYMKIGVVLWVREGLSIQIFIDRKRMNNAKRFYKLCCDQREERLRTVGPL